jgi:uncharacterized oxidoreductase
LCSTPKNADAIRDFAARLTSQHPGLNAIVDNAGIIRLENLLDPGTDLADAEATVATNLLGPIRLTAALLSHLLKQPAAAILTVTPGLAFVPLDGALTQLRDTADELMGLPQAADPRAMPLGEFIVESWRLISAQPTRRRFSSNA